MASGKVLSFSEPLVRGFLDVLHASWYIHLDSSHLHTEFMQFIHLENIHFVPVQVCNHHTTSQISQSGRKFQSKAAKGPKPRRSARPNLKCESREELIVTAVNGCLCDVTLTMARRPKVFGPKLCCLRDCFS